MIPVMEQLDTQGNLVRVYVSIPFKQLKEFKIVCSPYRPPAPFTPTLLENMAVETLPPGDQKQRAKACLSGRDYLLWKTEFAEQCQVTAEIKWSQ